jgi:hypothetical protein
LVSECARRLVELFVFEEFIEILVLPACRENRGLGDKACEYQAQKSPWVDAFHFSPSIHGQFVRSSIRQGQVHSVYSISLT